MKRIFLDANTFFDFVYGRAPFYHDVWQIISMASRKEIICGTNPNCFPHAFHQLKKEYKDWADLKHRYAMLRQVIDCGVLDGSVLDSALTLTEPKDLEDAIMLKMAIDWKADYLLTRDKKGFPATAMKIMSPKAFLSSWDFS